MKRIYLSVTVFIITTFAYMAYAQTGTLRVEISGIDEIKGLVSTGLYSNEEGFPDKGKEYKGADVEITGQTIVYTFKDLSFGIYAIALFHDINSNGKLDKNFLGIPTEGYAFSNNLFGAFGLPPGFKDASFEVRGDKTINIKMDY
jgi:uncharacterized protein (DUF2141 family)